MFTLRRTGLFLLGTQIFLYSSSAEAQSPSVSVHVCGLIGALFNSADVQAAREQWQRLDPDVAQCFIRLTNLQPNQLATQCVSPDDPRLSGAMNSCRQSVYQAQVREQQEATARDAAERARQEQAAAIEKAQQARLAADEQARKAKLAADALEKAKRDARIKELNTKYGDDAAAIIVGEVHTGMTRDEVIEARGNPIGREIVPPDDELLRFPDDRVVLTQGKVTYVGK